MSFLLSCRLMATPGSDPRCDPGCVRPVSLGRHLLLSAEVGSGFTCPELRSPGWAVCSGFLPVGALRP